MKTYLVLILSLLLWSCSSGITQKTIIEDRIIKAPVPAIEETLPAVIYDTVLVAQRVVEHDTVLVVKYFPKTQTFYVHAKPDSVKIIIRDTVQTFTGYTESDLSSANFKGWKWGIGITIFLIVGGGAAVMYLKSKFS